MRTYLVVLAFFLAVPIASGTFQPTREVDFWRTSGFDLAQARRYFSETTCRANADLYAACVEAFQQADSMLGSVAFRFLLTTSLQSEPKANFDDLIGQVEQFVSSPNVRYPKEMIYGSMTNTLLREFDSHASLLPAEYLKAMYAGPVRETTGIGVEEEINGKGLVIRRVYSPSPAAKVGLKVNDRVLSIDGEPVRPGIKAIKAMKRMALAAGQSVEVKILREGQVHSISVTLANLTLPDVALDFPQFGDSTFAVATLRTFGSGVCANLREQLALVRTRIKGLVLDLRGNPGGPLNEAACVMNLFTDATTFVVKKSITSPLPAAELGLPLTFGPEEQNNWRSDQRAAEFTTLPLIVLVNASSASASEMLAAALQDHRRAWIVGEPTFGKGSTQGTVKDPTNPQLHLIYTVSRYYRPNGAPLQLIGVTPNFIVPFEQAATPPERQFPREADFYGSKLQREEALPWQETRVADLKLVQRCLKKSKADTWFNTALKNQTGFEDYQKAKALSLLHCTPKPNAT